MITEPERAWMFQEWEQLTYPTLHFKVIFSLMVMLSELCGNVFQVASFYLFLSSTRRRIACGSEFPGQTWQGWRGCERWSDPLSLLKQSCVCPTPEGELAAGPQGVPAPCWQNQGLLTSLWRLPVLWRQSDTLSPVGAEETVNRHPGEMSSLW